MYKVLKNIIIDYKCQLEHIEKFKKTLKQIDIIEKHYWISFTNNMRYVSYYSPEL